MWLWLGRVVLPAPALFEFLEDEGNAPAGFFVDFCEDLKYFLLFAAVGEAFGGVGEGSEGDACYASGMLC